jgi:DNA primase
MLMDNVINDIRKANDIVDVISSYVPLSKKGKNYFGVCPFHDDTNPSMSVSRDKQIYKCFSCGAAGNVFTFLMNYDHLEFRDALAYLGDKVGIKTGTVKVNKKSTKYDKLYEANSLATKYFQNNLSSTNGRKARDYLKKRGIDDNLIKRFEIGLSLVTNDDLTKLLTSKNYDLAMLNEIGLSNNSHDMYIDRIMFPLKDINDRYVGFSGRIYYEADTSKYINTKESPIFIKGEMLYNYVSAREVAREKKQIIIMEGFMDVIRAASIGIDNCVALMGTAMTHEQIKLIRKLSNNIVLCLDGDDPGLKAMLKNGELLLQDGVEVKIIKLPNNDDPDTYIINNGKESFINLIDNAISFSDFKLSMMKENVNFNNIEDKSRYINSVLREIAKIDDKVRIEIMLKDIAKEYDLSYNTLEKQLLEYKDKKEVNTKIVSTPKKVVKKDKYQKAIEQVLYLMLNNDWVINKVIKANLNYLDDKYRLLNAEILYYYNNYGRINVADFYTYIQDRDEVIQILNDILACDYNEDVEEDELEEYFKVIKSQSKKKEIERLTTLIKKEYDPLKQAEIANKIMELRKGEQ